MKLTKYEHACFTVEKDGQVLVVDPGGLSPDFIAPAGVVAVVYTHDHFDHFNHEILESIIDKNPEAIVVAHPSITSKIEVFSTQAVTSGETITVGPFTLAFCGDVHALTHASVPPAPNLGIMINELLYYPGDSFTLPGQPVDTLALPVDAPWMMLGEAMDFLTAVKPRLAFSTHDALLSPAGQEVVDNWLNRYAAANDIEYKRLDTPIEI